MLSRGGATLGRRCRRRRALRLAGMTDHRVPRPRRGDRRARRQGQARHLRELAAPLARHMPVPADRIYAMLAERENRHHRHRRGRGHPPRQARRRAAADRQLRRAPPPGSTSRPSTASPPTSSSRSFAPENSAGLHLKALARISRPSRARPFARPSSRPRVRRRSTASSPARTRRTERLLAQRRATLRSA